MDKSFPKELVTGVEKIDFQHMELFARIWQLYDSYLEGKSREKVTETMKYLKCYVNEHFITEEKYMMALDYPDIDWHRKCHREFYNEFCLLEMKFEAKGFNPDFNLDMNLKIAEWLKKHVMEEDKRLAVFIQTVRAEEAVS